MQAKINKYTFSGFHNPEANYRETGWEQTSEYVSMKF